MLKPKLLNTALPSTAVSKNLLSSTYTPLQTTIMKSTMRQFHNPMVSSFNKGTIKKQQLRFTRYQEPVLQKESKSNEQSSWVNTSDIESVIGKRIEADIQLSVERTFREQKYFLGPERICTQKILPLPIEIKSILEQRGSSNEKMHMVYGYLTSLNAVYYIIEQDLYIFSINDLKIRQEAKQQKAVLPEKVYKPTKLRPNCQKIYQAQFPFNHSNKMIPKQFSGKVLILQYLYEIELCCYVVGNRIEKIEIPKEGSIQNREQKNFLTLISLNAKIPIETASAQFITVTQKGQLLYLNEKGQVVCFQFSKTDDTRLKRKTHQQNEMKKKKFISTNQKALDAAKIYFWNMFDFRHSIFLSRRNNLSLIYDNKNNRIYTLTVHGDRSTMIQQTRKEIKVYEFLNTEKSVELNCIMSVSEQEFLKQIMVQTKTSKTRLFTILKAQPDYNQQSDLIALLTNGTKVYLRFTSEKMMLVHVSMCPNIDMLRNSNKQRKKNLMEISKSFMSKDQNEKIQRSLSENFQIQTTKDTDLSIKSYFKNRSLSIGLIRNKDQYSMFMTLKKSFGSSNEFDVFPIYWKKETIFHDVEKFPTENHIFTVESSLNQNSTNYEINRLQRNQYEKNKTADSDLKNLRPVSNNCHQLLRQVHHSPMSFVYLSNKFITNFTLLRPIDILHMMVASREEIFCQMYLPSILGLEPYQISCMLLQLYTVQEGTYYKSANYSNKINLLIDKLRQNTKKYQTLSEKSTLSTFSSSNQIQTSNKQIFEQKKQDKLEVITYNTKGFEKIKSKIRRLFVFFCKLQQTKNPNAFQKIKLKFSNITMSSQVQDKIDKLNQEQKGQAQYCLLYISRVLYPLWRAKISSSEVSRHTLYSLKQKVMQTFQVVELLKNQCNDYWTHLKIFLKKIVQIIQMCMYISQLPSTLTLADAVSKEPTYFQPYIFGTLRRETSPQMLRIFINKFPFYVSKYFETLIKIFMQARITINIEQIKSMLGRLSQYPDYFIDFLKEQKGFKDLSFLRIRGQIVRAATNLQIPDLPFSNLIQYLHSRVTSTSVKMDEKFMFLKEAKKRIDKYNSQQMRKIEVFPPQVLDRLQKQYDELFKCLKLQQECKNEIIKIAQETYDQNKSLQGEQNRGFFSNLLSKVSFLSSQSAQNKKPLIQKRLTLVLDKQHIKKVQNQYQVIFRKLNYFALSREDLKLLILQIKSPRLLIIYYSMFQGRGISEVQKQNFRFRLYSFYCEIVNEGIKKYDIRMSCVINKKENFSKFVDYIRREVRQIILFLNMTKTPILFPPLYQGIKKQMIKIDGTLKFIIDNVQQCIYSVGHEVVSIGFDKGLVLNHLTYESINRNFCAQGFQDQDDSEYCLKNWIYDWYMAVDFAKKSRKQQELESFVILAKNILESKKNFLQSRSDYKEFLQKGIQSICNFINGNNENQIEMKNILQKIMCKLK